MIPPRGQAIVERWLQSPRTVWIACAASLALGLFLTFVWSPLPWTWEGIDHYHDRAITLAAGRPFDTTDVPWGYAYYLAAFYAVFGPVPWIPLVGQVLLNALTPLLLFHLVAALADRRLATLSALLVGFFSFNTVYASTQAADAVCTVLLLSSLLAFARGRRGGHWMWLAASGLLAGAAIQFRPNLLLLPPVIAAAHLLVPPRRPHRLREAAVYLSLVAAALTPWVVRNYRLTDRFLPTSTHGGVQLWYGTLQVGPYLESRAHNPRSVFEAPAFDYSSLPGLPLIVTAAPRPCAPPASYALVYWTSHDRAPHRVAPAAAEGGMQFVIPGQPDGTAISYYVEARNATTGDTVTTPPGAERAPRLFFVSTDHLRDMDRGNDLLDAFDLLRLVRAVAWHEPHDTLDPRLDANADRRLDTADIQHAAARLLSAGSAGTVPAAAIEVTVADGEAVVTAPDGSTLRFPRVISGRITDLIASGGLAAELVYAHRPWGRLDAPAPPADACLVVDDLAVNAVFYRREPHLMQRYTALALDNIRRQPLAFAAASAYRALRLFVMKGSDDRHTAQQFSGSGIIYTAGFVLSLAYFLALAVGAAISLRRRMPLALLLIPVLYVPLTICFVLTNMRYTTTVQPLVFAFVAVTLLTGWDRWRSPAGR